MCKYTCICILGICQSDFIQTTYIYVFIWSISLTVLCYFNLEYIPFFLKGKKTTSRYYLQFKDLALGLNVNQLPLPGLQFIEGLL